MRPLDEKRPAMMDTVAQNAVLIPHPVQHQIVYSLALNFVPVSIAQYRPF